MGKCPPVLVKIFHQDYLVKPVDAKLNGRVDVNADLCHGGKVKPVPAKQRKEKAQAYCGKGVSAAWSLRLGISFGLF